MKKLYTSLAIVAIILGVKNLQAQNQANVWYFGQAFGLNFNTSPPAPTVLTNGSNQAYSGEGEGTSSICDASGNLLLYSDGDNIYNGSGTLITAVSSNYNIAQNLIVPNPANPNQYYYINPWGADRTSNIVQGIQYTILSATTPSNGAVVGTANQTLYTTTVTQAMTVVPDQSNGYWLVAHAINSNNFIVWHLTNAGFSAPSFYAVGMTTANNNQVIAMLKTNSCFNQLAFSYFNASHIQIVDFNNATGAITTVLYDITNFEFPQNYGVEFSPDGTILYSSLNGESSGGANCRLYQFNLSAGASNINLAANRFTLDNIGPGGAVNRFGAVQLGPDSKVYMTTHADWGNNGGGVSVINNPNVFGTAAGYNRLLYQNTNGSITSWPAEGLPPVLRSFLTGNADFGSNLPVVGGSLYVCAGNTTTFNITFNGAIGAGTTTVNWNYPSGTPTIISGTPTSVSNTYSTAGTYTAQLAFQDICSRVYKVQKTINVTGIITTGNVSCNATPATVTLSGTGSGKANYLWFQSNNSVLGYGATLGKSYPTSTAIPAFFTVLDATTIGSNITAGPTNYGGTGDYDVTGGNSTTFNILQNTVLDGLSVRKAANYADGTVTPRTGTISVIQGGKIIASTSVNINTNQNVGVVTTFSNLGLFIPAGTGYTLSITGTPTFSANYNPTNTPVNVASLVLFTATTSPFYNLQFRQISPCSNLTTVTGVCVLPVSFLSFEANDNGNQISVQWSTGQEVNNKGFIVEKSSDGQNFLPIGTVGGSGNTNYSVSYTFDDKNPWSGVSYYRLVQIDFDGNLHYSSIVSINKSTTLKVELYPNPFSNDITLSVLTKGSIGKGQLNIYSLTGDVIFQSQEDFGQPIQFGSSLSKGFYIVEIVTNGFSNKYKIVKE
jgi:hypothetical protein